MAVAVVHTTRLSVAVVDDDDGVCAHHVMVVVGGPLFIRRQLWIKEKHKCLAISSTRRNAHDH
jgi:hypothetical protein